jgi:hypothetical protein
MDASLRWHDGESGGRCEQSLPDPAAGVQPRNAVREDFTWATRHCERSEAIQF